MNAKQLANKILANTQGATPYVSEDVLLSMRKAQILNWIFMQDKDTTLPKILQTAEEANAIIYQLHQVK